jgi:hypothetical protein
LKKFKREIEKHKEKLERLAKHKEKQAGMSLRP